jgi:lipoprotein NlpD
MRNAFFTLDAGIGGWQRWLRLLLLGSLLPVLLSACGAHVYHIVQPGETVYSVSFRYQQDYHNVMAWNGLQTPYGLKAGQQLRVAPPRGPSFGETLAAARGQNRPVVRQSSVPMTRSASVAPVEEAVTIPLDSPSSASAASPSTAASRGLISEPISAPPQQIARVEPPEVAAALKPPAATDVPIWQWPVRRADARVEPARRGLEIRAGRGEPIYAAANGKVVYSGSGIPHFGNLIIIKHDERFLSAYAHNERLLVSDGASVRAGQQIAEMGDSGTANQEVRLHFEIRLDGTPVDPMQYLPYRRGG